jgi:flagellar motor switch protein FliN/FliY
MPVVAGGAVVDGDAGVLVFVTGSTAPAGLSSAGVSSASKPAAERGGMQLLSDVSMTVTAELGRARMTVRELLELAPGAIVELDRTAGMPIDVLVNGTVVARGEVVVVDEEFGVRVTEIVGTENA